MRRILRLGAAISLAALPPASPYARQEPDALHRVQQARLLVVARLAHPEVLTAEGVDYGRALLEVERVVYPVGASAERLLLRWTPGAAPTPPGADPRKHEEIRALWLLERDIDGAVRMIDRDGAIVPATPDALERLVQELQPFRLDIDAGKLSALEALAEQERLMPPSGERRDEGPPSPVISEKTDFALQDYRSYPLFKAFAVAVDAAGRWAYGYVHELPDEDLAVERALAECSIRAARTRVDAACRLYAVGDRIVWRASGEGN